MSEKARFFFGLGSIVVILGTGLFMTVYSLKESAAQISVSDWTKLQTTVQELASIHQTPSQEVVSVTTTSEPSADSSQTSPVNLVQINLADQAELESLTGIGPARAVNIMDARATGPFVDLDDLHVRVSKIPASVLKEISQEITFE